jgi:ribosome-associated protein
MIKISNSFSIPSQELSFEFMRSSGPGGQNVNKVASAVRLKFDVVNSPTLSPEIKSRLYNLAGSRINKDGVLTIVARNTRTQKKNRQAAIERFRSILQMAEKRPKLHLKTSVPRHSKRKRLESKKHRARRKLLRHSPTSQED